MSNPPPLEAECLSPAPDVLASSAAGGLLIRGGVLRFAGYAGQLGLSVISTAVLTRHLGVSRFGQYTTVLSLVAVVAVVTDAGMANIGIRDYAILDGPKRDALMRDLLGLRVVLTLLGVALTVAFAIAAGYDQALLLGALVASLATVALVYQHTLSIPLSVQLRLGTLSGLELTRQALLVGGLVLLAALGAGVFPLLAVTLLANLGVVLPTAVLVRGRISTRMSLHPRAWPPLLRATVAFSLATAVGAIYVYTAQITTSLVTTHHQTGLFAVSFRVFVVSVNVPALLVSATLPVLARAARDDHVRLAYALKRIFQMALIGGVGGALALSTGSGFVVSVIAGHRYAAAAPVLAVQSIALVGTFVAAGWSFGLLALRMHRPLLLANLAAMAVNMLLTLALASIDGARGAAIATLSGELTLALACLLALSRRNPAFRPEPAVIAKVAVATVPAAVVAWLISVPSVLRAVIAVALYGAVIVLTRALPGELRALLPAASHHR